MLNSLQVEELKTNLMSLVVFISLIFAQHVSNINMHAAPTYHTNRTVVLQPAKRTPPSITRSKPQHTTKRE